MRYLIIILCFFSFNALAEDVTIEMLNKFEGESMVFSKKIAKVNIGDTVFWKATDLTHNVEFIKKAVPEGVEKFKSKINKNTQYTFTISGIYAYWCTPHKSLGMIGFVIVDDDKHNLKQVKKIKFFGRSKKIAISLIEQL